MELGGGITRHGRATQRRDGLGVQDREHLVPTQDAVAERLRELLGVERLRILTSVGCVLVRPLSLTPSLCTIDV
jgi:hypothetical protein